MKLNMKNTMQAINLVGSLCNLVNVGIGVYIGVKHVQAEVKRKPIGFVWDYEEDKK